jgi:hypothetical protein
VARFPAAIELAALLNLEDGQSDATVALEGAVDLDQVALEDAANLGQDVRVGPVDLDQDVLVALADLDRVVMEVWVSLGQDRLEGRQERLDGLVCREYRQRMEVRCSTRWRRELMPYWFCFLGCFYLSGTGGCSLIQSANSSSHWL